MHDKYKVPEIKIRSNDLPRCYGFRKQIFHGIWRGSGANLDPEHQAAVDYQVEFKVLRTPLLQHVLVSFAFSNRKDHVAAYRIRAPTVAAHGEHDVQIVGAVQAVCRRYTWKTWGSV